MCYFVNTAILVMCAKGMIRAFKSFFSLLLPHSLCRHLMAGVLTLSSVSQQSKSVHQHILPLSGNYVFYL